MKNNKSSHKSKYSIKDMQKLAAQRGGKCLSDNYINTSIKLKWQCADGHIWSAIPMNVIKGCWCSHPICVGRKISKSKDKFKHTIQEMQQIAEARGGKCLSTAYINNRTKLQWQCADGHVWLAVPGSIMIGQWCPSCKGKRISKSKDKYKLTIQAMQKIAEDRAGKCLSDTYTNNSTKLLWECSEKHQWWAAPGKIIDGQWCPRCGGSKNEEFCRVIFEHIFKRKFSKTRPQWLLSDKGGRLEYDGYCPELSMAFEYHGEQHYRITGRLHDSLKRLVERKATDDKKRGLSKSHGITLIEIPYFKQNITANEMIDHVVNCLKKAGIKIPRFNRRISFGAAYKKGTYEKLQKIIAERGGQLLTDSYLGIMKKHLVKCSCGRTWETTPANIFDGKWCYVCSMKAAGKLRRLGIDKMHQIARERRGRCLSKEYVNSQTKLKWRCAKGHIWEAIPNNIMHDRWCPVCAKENIKLTIDEMKAIAKSRNGECLSKEYVNNHTRLKWRCDKGHEWESKPLNIKLGKWCPLCGRKKQGGRLTIEDMKAIAEAKGGLCLSKEYMHSQAKLLWQCQIGHKWKAAPKNIKNGSWCPVCVKATHSKYLMGTNILSLQRTSKAL